MDGKNRILYFAVVIGLALTATLVPQWIEGKNPRQHPGAAAKPAATAPQQDAPRPAAPAAKPEDERARKALQRLGTIETGSYLARVTNLNGGLTQFELKGKRYRTSGKPLEMVTTDKESFLPLAIDVAGLPEAAPPVYALSQVSPEAVTLSGESGGVRVTRKLQAGKGPYQLWLTTHLENSGSQPQKLKLRVTTYRYVPREDEGKSIPFLPVRSAATSHAACRHGDDLDRLDRKKLEAPHEFGETVAWSGVENTYFLTAIAPDGGDARKCRLEADNRGNDKEGKPLGTLFSSRVEYTEVTLAPGQSRSFRTLAYLGPKSPAELATAGHELKRSIESGWFTSLAEALTFLLRKIHAAVGNWGIAIILLTFVVKLLLFPVTAKQMHSMAKMKELKPELDKLNELYADDREKKGAAMMELYKKRGVNPMAGCLPVLLQMPIWFSLYASLSSNVELFRAPFALWWHDLSSPDPFFVLPLALGALMFVQQKMSPATGMDPVQQKMMLYMMPTMITSFMLFLPAGLCLYMFTNSALSILQQRVIEARLRRPPSPPSESQDPPASQTQAPTISSISPSRAERGGRPSKAERRWRRGKR